MSELFGGVHQRMANAGIESLDRRAARSISAEKHKPFELKTSFPYGTPPDSCYPNPPIGPAR
jgi:hypothetical protein